MYLLGILAVGFYAFKVPERYFPGKKDGTLLNMVLHSAVCNTTAILSINQTLVNHCCHLVDVLQEKNVLQWAAVLMMITHG